MNYSQVAKPLGFTTRAAFFQTTYSTWAFSGDKTMRALPAVIALSLMVLPALAASSQVVSAVKAFESVLTDASRLKTFCELMQIDEKNEKRTNPSLEAQMDKLLTELGADFEAAWELVEDTDPASEDGKVLDAALDRLSDKFPVRFSVIPPERRLSRLAPLPVLIALYHQLLGGFYFQ